MEHKFRNRIEEQKVKLRKESMLFNIIGYVKLFLILFFVVTIFFMFTQEKTTIFIVAAIIEFMMIIVAWVYHHSISEKMEYSSNIISINERHINRITGDWNIFEDIGEEFIDKAHPYACDLDIVGQQSLFQLLNTTHSWHGRQQFAKDLLRSGFSKEELIKRQNAIKELSEDIDFTIDMEYYFSKIGIDSRIQQLVLELNDEKTFLQNRVLKFILKYVPIAVFLFIAAVCIFQLKSLFVISAILSLLQLIVWVVGMPKTYDYLRTITHLPYRLISYSIIIDILKDKEFQSEKLKQIQSQLATSELSAAHAISKLSKISDKVSVRHNGIIYFVLNVFLLWDYECAFDYEDWKIKYASLANTWFMALGEFESLMCFSHLPNISNNYCLPNITDEKKIYAQEMGHPLIRNDIRVNNDVECENNIFIISGSNMSGKTTYLRTIGVNMVLARVGSFVCAKQMEFSYLSIMTSMRIADDLNEGISTFYAEIKRIKEIINSATNDENILFLIDEIFRGTNSVDRIMGAKAVITTLNDLQTIGFISTHDLELCELTAQFPAIKNYSFSEQYINDTISFDYKLNYYRLKAGRLDCG